MRTRACVFCTCWVRGRVCPRRNQDARSETGLATPARTASFKTAPDAGINAAQKAAQASTIRANASRNAAWSTAHPPALLRMRGTR